jgi:hypothetical protein
MGKAKEWTGEGQKANTGIENAKSKWGGVTKIMITRTSELIIKNTYGILKEG